MKIIQLLLVFCMVHLASALAQSYQQEYPTNMRAKMTLKPGTVCPSYVAREIEFKNKDDELISVTVHFRPTSTCNYDGAVVTGNPSDYNDIDDLRLLAELNNRTYWDDMYIANNGGGSTLEITSLTIEIEYNNGVDRNFGFSNSFWEVENDISGRMASGILPGINVPPVGKKTLALSNWKFRACDVCNFLSTNGIEDNDGNVYDNCTSLSHISQCVTNLQDNFQSWTRAFMYDLGKSGSDTELRGGESLPKYGDDEALCTETVAWYYGRYAYTSGGNDGFYEGVYENRDNMTPLRNFFRTQGRLYCYLQGNWIKNTGAAPTGPWRPSQTIDPMAGDIIFYEWTNAAGDDLKHTQMVVDWDDTNDTITFIDGPRVGMGQLDVSANSLPQYFFCVGRIPNND